MRDSEVDNIRNNKIQSVVKGVYGIVYLRGGGGGGGDEEAMRYCLIQWTAKGLSGVLQSSVQWREWSEWCEPVDSEGSGLNGVNQCTVKGVVWMVWTSGQWREWSEWCNPVYSEGSGLFFFSFVRWKFQSPRWRWQCIAGPSGLREWSKWCEPVYSEGSGLNGVNQWTEKGVVWMVWTSVQWREWSEWCEPVYSEGSGLNGVNQCTVKGVVWMVWTKGQRRRMFVGCLTSQQQASVSQGRICSDNFTCCHTWDRSCRSNVLPHPVTVYWHRANQSQCWPYNGRRLAG